MDGNSENFPILGAGVYSVPEASRLLGVSQQQLRRWLVGSDRFERVWSSDYDECGDFLEISFTDLMEARVVNALRSQGVSLQHIRKAREIARAQFNLEKPFSTGRFRTDGKRVFWEAAQKLAAVDPKLEDLMTGQMIFWSVVERTFKSVDIEGGLARRWWPQNRKRSIVLDPLRSFGQPILDKTGIPTAALKNAFDAEGEASIVARLFEVSKKEVVDAIEFEERLTA